MRRIVLLGLALAAGACSEQTATHPAAPAVSDAFKSDTADENPRIMWQGAATPVTITGDRFHPIAVDTLLAGKRIEVPRLFLTGPDRVELSDVVWLDSQTMAAVIPAGIDIEDPRGFADFMVVARDPAGAETKTSGAAFRVSTFQTPIVTGVAVAAGGGGSVFEFCGTTTTTTVPFDLTITGEHFAAPVTVGYAAALTDRTADIIPLAVKSVTGTTLVATVAAGVAPGTYDIRVINRDEQQVTFRNAFEIRLSTTGCPVITSVVPRFVYPPRDTRIQITGNGFLTTPQASLRRADYSASVSYESMITSGTVVGYLLGDATRAYGAYDVIIRNPNGSEAVSPGAVLLVDKPLPTVTAVNPDSFRSFPADFIVEGADFADDVTLGAYDASGAFYPAVVNSVSPTRIEARFDVALPLGTAVTKQFVLRVHTQTGQGTVYTDYWQIVVTGPSGNTDDFVVDADVSLRTARRDFGLVGARDPLGSRFLYVAGGRTTNSLTLDAADGLDTIEIAPIDDFGRLQNFRVNRTRLPNAIFGHGLAEIEGWLYVVGGYGPAGVLDSVYKAKVLDPRQAPEIRSLAAGTGGTLEPGSWLYQVSAVLAAGDPDNPGGETLPSISVGFQVPATGSVNLSWTAVPNADKYRIYRTDSPNVIGQATHLVAEIPAAACSPCTYTDDGDAAGTVEPLEPGSLGTWQAAGNLAQPRAFHATAVGRDIAGNAVLVALGGLDDDGATILNTYDYAALAAGADVVFATATTTMASARVFPAAAVATPQNVLPANLPTGADEVCAAGGATTLAAGLGNAQRLRDMECGPIENGSIPSFTQTGGNTLLSNSTLGTGALYASNVFFQIGGSQQVAPTTAALSTAVTSGLLSDPGNGSIAANPNANPNLNAARGFFGYTRFNARIFVIGGVRDENGTAALTNTVEWVDF